MARVRGKRVNNPSLKKPVTANQVIKIASQEDFIDKFNPLYHQVMLRVSNAPQGLRYGAPPGKVEWGN